MSEEAVSALYEEYARTPVLAALAEGRPLVPGSGPADSPFVVVGEAPGEEEERRGIPFCGKSGKLLREIFGDAGIPWELCYVMNVVPWRPPGNRTPYPFEIQASWGRVEKEIAEVDPVVVVTAGDVAWRGVTRGDMGACAAARFLWHDLDGRRLLALPHPAFLLRMRDRGEQAQWRKATTEALATAVKAPASA